MNEIGGEGAVYVDPDDPDGHGRGHRAGGAAPGRAAPQGARQRRPLHAGPDGGRQRGGATGWRSNSARRSDEAAGGAGGRLPALDAEALAAAPLLGLPDRGRRADRALLHLSAPPGDGGRCPHRPPECRHPPGADGVRCAFDHRALQLDHRPCARWRALRPPGRARPGAAARRARRDHQVAHHRLHRQGGDRGLHDPRRLPLADHHPRHPRGQGRQDCKPVRIGAYCLVGRA